MKPKDKKKHQIKSKFIIALINLFSIMPFQINRRLGSTIGWFSWVLNTKVRKISTININICFPNRSNDEKKKLIKQSCIESGKVLTESFWVWKQSNDNVLDLINKVTGLELIEEALKQGRGLILTGPHVGNWEVLLKWGGTQLDSSGMYSIPKIKQLEPIIKESRIKSGIDMIKADHTGVRQMLKTLKSGRVLMMLSDQRPKKNGGVFAPFYEKQAYTMILIKRLIEKTHAPVLFFSAIRNVSGFEIIIEKSDNLALEDSVEEYALSLNKMLEKQINRVPEQFEWAYKKFHPQPDTIEKVIYK